MSLFDKWLDRNKVYNFEGDVGVSHLEKLIKTLGYGHKFRYGDPIQHFLSDNPGAIEALLEWAEENMTPEWRATLAADLGVTVPLDNEDEGDV